MQRRCKNCGKVFNVGAYGEEYCPYCGTVLDDKSRQKIRNYEYFWKRYFIPLLLGIILVIAVVVWAVSPKTTTPDFETQITRVTSELKDVGSLETFISIYGTLKANVECRKVRITCEVYSKYDLLVCVPAGVFEIKKGQTIEFNVFARPQNSGDLDTPLHVITSVSIVN